MTTKSHIQLQKSGRAKVLPSHRKGKSKYAGLFERMNQLTPGQYVDGEWDGPRVVVNLKQGGRSIDSKTFLNRLTGAIKTGIGSGLLKPPPDGYEYEKRTLEGGKQVMIVLVKSK